MDCLIIYSYVYESLAQETRRKCLFKKRTLFAQLIQTVEHIIKYGICVFFSFFLSRAKTTRIQIFGLVCSVFCANEVILFCNLCS